MKHMLWLILMVVSCDQQKSFSGASTEVADTEATAVETSAAEVSAPVEKKSIDNCVDGDRVIFAFSGAVKQCIDSGRTWHFETSTCVSMPKATFSCDFATVQGKLSELNLLTETLKNDAAAGAKLISCGQSADGNRIAVQWLRPVSGVSCEKLQDGFGITTGCYTHHADGASPPPATTDAERRTRVNACLQSL